MLDNRLFPIAAAAATLLLSGCGSLNGTVTVPERLYSVNVSEDVVVEDAVQERVVKFRVAWPEADGSFPLIVFSHGALCNPDTYAPATDYWAARGYVVVAPVHLDAPATGAGGEKLPPPVLIGSRVREMSLALDEIDAIRGQLNGFDGTIDTARAVAAGHSFGGMIAMLKTGLRLNGNLPPATDARYTAAMIMSGVGPMPPITDESSFAGLTLPLFANGGSLDVGNIGSGEIFPWQWRMSPYSLAPEGDKYALEIANADHFLGGLIGGKTTENPEDPDALDWIRAAQAEFLDAYVKGNDSARQTLVNTNWQKASDGRAELKTK